MDKIIYVSPQIRQQSPENKTGRRKINKETG